MGTLYDVIRVRPQASFEELRAAYRARAKTLHPDRVGASGDAYDAAVRAMQELNAAWDVLRDPTRRRGYDLSIGITPRPRGRRARGRRAVRFPLHRSMGTVYARAGKTRTGALSAPESERAAVWERVAAARADVWVRAEVDVKVVVARSALYDLAALEDLGPEDVQVLDLSALPVEDRELKHVAAMTGLDALDLRGTPVTDEGLAQLTPLVELTELALGGTAVTDEGLALLASFPRLRDVDLSGTAVTPEGLRHLWRVPGLRRLGLAGVALDEDGAATLAGLRLRRLDLQETRLGLDTVLRLKSSLPGCMVLRGA